MASWKVLIVCLAAVCNVQGAVPLVGYFCASCPANHNPSVLIGSIHPAYGTVIMAFVGWQASGEIINSWDCDGSCGKNFTLTRGHVQTLQTQGRKVLMSLGGQNGGTLNCAPSPSFASTLASQLIGLVSKFGFDGFDFDIESRGGTDMVACSKVVASVISHLKNGHSALKITLAPQMTDLYPYSQSITPAFNDQSPLVSMAGGDIDLVMVQMYNTWAQVETIVYAQKYGSDVMHGFTAVDTDGSQFRVAIPGSKLMLGFPASRGGASTGFIDPAEVASLYGHFQALGTPIAGIMTWSIGWDESNNWMFAEEMARH